MFSDLILAFRTASKKFLTNLQNHSFISNLITLSVRISQAKKDVELYVVYTVHFEMKKLSTKSSWEFECVLHTSDTY